MKFCHNPSHFAKEQVEGIIVCEDLLISKLLASFTHSETKALINCLNNSGLNDEKGIKECIADFRNPKDPEEQNLIKQIRDKYCSNRVYIYQTDQDACMDNFLESNMTDLDISAECNARVSDLGDQTQKSIALQRCQRMEQHKKLLADKTLEVSDCWKSDKYPTMEERRTCRDQAYDFNFEVDQCEEEGSNNAILQCLALLDNGCYKMIVFHHAILIIQRTMVKMLMLQSILLIPI